MSQKGREKLDATGEFFSVGAPLHAVRAGYIKRRADDLLYETVLSGRYAHVIAPDRSGKSSLIAATAARLESQGCKIAILDLAQIGMRDSGGDAGRWYYNVAYRLQRQLRIRFDLQEWWQDKSFLSNRQRLVEFYSEVLLQHVSEHMVVFIDEVQCIEDRPYADQLLASIRAAHNARTTDPDFSRLVFVLSGECDPVSLVAEAELSPFNTTQPIPLDDFSRDEMNLFATELNLANGEAQRALDRVHYWTNGQPYLVQKMARSISREGDGGSSAEDVHDLVDRVALQQLAGRAALHSEPHMSHIHRRLATGDRDSEILLNLYGRMRKGIEVAADLGSAAQRRLMAVGLVVIDDDGNLAVRNRLYGAVFTTRWANENLSTRLRIPLAVAGALLLLLVVPFWYTQWLPGPYVDVLANPDTRIDVAHDAYSNLASFPGHRDAATGLFRRYLEQRAAATDDLNEIDSLAGMFAELPGSGRQPDAIRAAFWDRRLADALRTEQRDAALLASLQSLVLSTPQRRQRAASLIGDDYPLLVSTLPSLPSGTTVFDPDSGLLSTARGATITQWSFAAQALQQRDPWPVTALEVTPLVRRVMVDRQGVVGRIGMTLNLSHGRLADLRIKVIAPSGRTVEVEPGVERASSGDDIRIPAAALTEFIGESLNGTWSISVRDEALGVAGQLVGWNLTLNAQGAVEHFQRGLNIPEPIERETDNIWFDRSGRYAIARAMLSDSARIWDLSLAEPIRAVAVSESEALIGLDTAARRLVTSTQNSVNVWDTSSGDKIATLSVGPASMSARLTADGSQLFVVQRSDEETRIQLWSLDEKRVTAELSVAGSPAHVVTDAVAARVAVADFDRAVRVWDLASGELLAQLDLAMQPSRIELSPDGMTLGALYSDAGLSLWRIAEDAKPLLETSATGRWQLAFSPTGRLVVAGRPATGFQVYSSQDGRIVGPALGLESAGEGNSLPAFSADEQFILTGSPQAGIRVWRTPVMPASVADSMIKAHQVWNPAADQTVIATPDGRTLAVGDADGHVHIVAIGERSTRLADIGEDVSFLGHSNEIRLLAADSAGRRVASVAADNTLRVWQVDNGEPLPWTVSLHGFTPHRLGFAADTTTLAAGADNALFIVDTDAGEIVAEFDLPGMLSDIEFDGADRLFVATAEGSLYRVQRQSGALWQLQQIWQNETGIRALAVSPRAGVLAIVDNGNVVSQVSLADGQVSAASLQLPSSVTELVFDQAGTRLYIRTPRWVHRATASASGLHWRDAALLPRGLRGAGVVFRTDDNAATSMARAVLPVSRSGHVELFDATVAGSDIAGLIGSRDDLLAEWRSRISADLLATF